MSSKPKVRSLLVATGCWPAPRRLLPEVRAAGAGTGPRRLHVPPLGPHPPQGRLLRAPLRPPSPGDRHRPRRRHLRGQHPRPPRTGEARLRPVRLQGPRRLDRLSDGRRLGQPRHRQGQPGRLAQGHPRRRRRSLHPLLGRLGQQGRRRAPRLGPRSTRTGSATPTPRASSAPTSTSSSSPSSTRSRRSTASTASGPTASAGRPSSTGRPGPWRPGRRRRVIGTPRRTGPTRAGSIGKCSTAGPSSATSSTGSTPSTPPTPPCS